MSATASVRDAVVHLSLANLHPTEPAPVRCALDAARTSATARILSANMIDAHNTIERPDAVRPEPFADFRLDGDVLDLTLPPSRRRPRPPALRRNAGEVRRGSRAREKLDEGQ